MILLSIQSGGELATYFVQGEGRTPSLPTPPFSLLVSIAEITSRLEAWWLGWRLTGPLGNWFVMMGEYLTCPVGVGVVVGCGLSRWTT